MAKEIQNLEFKFKSGNGPVRVLIVDDQPLVRIGLRKILESTPGTVICVEAANGQDALAALRRQTPDLMIVDNVLEDASGLDLVGHVHERNPEVVMLVVSIHDEVVYAERALRSGALGYVHKLEPPAVMLKAVQAVLRGEVFVSDKIASNLMSKIAGRRTRDGAIIDVLTTRELQVFKLVGAGLGPGEIAQRLKINKNTVETFRARIKKKLHFRDAAEMRREAITWTHQPNG